MFHQRHQHRCTSNAIMIKYLTRSTDYVLKCKKEEKKTDYVAIYTIGKKQHENSLCQTFYLILISNFIEKKKNPKNRDILQLKI